jgi:hypothetical protein
VSGVRERWLDVKGGASAFDWRKSLFVSINIGARTFLY